MKYYFFVVSFLFPLILSSSLLAQASAYEKIDLHPVKIKKADWEAATQDLDYGTITPSENKTSREVDSAAITAILKILFVLGVAVFILLLLRLLIGAQGIQRSKRQKFYPNKNIDTHQVAENIHQYDLLALIKNAVKQKDYSRAVRLYYLLSIKTLSDKGLIQWKKDKTDHQYLNELISGKIKNQFAELTGIFELVWYGGVSLTSPLFSEIQQSFQRFIRQLEVH